MFFKQKKAAAVLFAAVMTAAITVSAAGATAHYNDSVVTGGSAAWCKWSDQWPSVASDYTKVSITPGRDDSHLNFAWYSSADVTYMSSVKFGTDKNKLQEFKGTTSNVDVKLTGSKPYVSNHVEVSGIKENSVYYYSVYRNGAWSDPVSYRSGSFENVKIMLVGDPQIGASKGQDQVGNKLAADSGAGNTAARNDGFAWNRTLSTAVSLNPDINFIISAGDQVNKTGKPKEEEYAAYLAPGALTYLPVATTIGNHDSLNTDYPAHFYDPNQTGLGKTAAGGDYYYTYGEGLFIVLNTNNYNAAEHEQTIAKAVASAPSAKWRIVTMHQDIYGAGADHSDSDGMILRTQLTPMFDKYDVDVVLQGHDHSYCRSKLLYSDGKTHSSYSFHLNSDGSDYDWDNAYDNLAGTKIPLAPDASDVSGSAAKSSFVNDNKCYTIESSGSSTVNKPEGILYITANSASGSKYYELATSQQSYVEVRNQNWLPSYSIIKMNASSFSIDTYQIKDDGTVEPIDKTFTITK